MPLEPLDEAARFLGGKSLIKRRRLVGI